MSPLFLWMAVIIQDIVSLDYSLAYDIELAECPIPDYPQWGGYGPRQDYYVPGDVIHYFCDTNAYIGGNYYRRCEDTGNWSGDTPVCDKAATFSSWTQSTTDPSAANNDAESAVDGARTSCTKTNREASGATWLGVLSTPGEMLRVMLFLPAGRRWGAASRNPDDRICGTWAMLRRGHLRFLSLSSPKFLLSHTCVSYRESIVFMAKFRTRVNVNYQVLSIKANGDEYSCGSKSGKISRQEWHFHNCLQPNNTGIVAIKIKSLSEEPLQLCELVVHVLTEPTCVDPHYPVDNGRFELSRKRASLLCDADFTRSTHTRLDCVRNGVWNRKSLYCIERQWDSGVEGNPGGVSPERELEHDV